MRQRVSGRHLVDRDEADTETDRVTASLAGLALALALVVAGLYLVGQLRSKAQVEDCLMAGRMNCDQLVTER